MRHPLSRPTLLALAGGVVLLLTVAFAFWQQRGAAIVFAAPTSVQGAVLQNNVLQYQGQLFNPNGGQVLANQTVNLSFRLYEQASGGSPLWQEDKSVTTNSDGLFNSQIGSNNGLNFDLFTGRALFLGVAINGEEGSPRLPITYVPYAIWARDADKLDGIGSEEFLRGNALAYGTIDANGNKVSGTNNWNSRIVVVSSDSVYEVRINGVDYREREYVTVVTPGCARPRMVGTGSSEGALIVDVWNENGSRVTDCRFQFATYRRP